MQTLMNGTHTGQQNYTDHRTILSPIRFDFTAPNFMSQASPPKITFYGMNTMSTTTATQSFVICWATGEAIPVDHTGISSILKAGEVLLTMQFERSLASDPQHFNESCGVHCSEYEIEKNLTNLCCSKGCGNIDACVGTFSLGIGYQPSPLLNITSGTIDLDGTSGVYSYHTRDSFSWYNYLQAYGELPKGATNATTLMLSNQPNGYTQFRVDWVLALTHMPLGPSWKLNVTTFNVNTSPRDFTSTTDSTDTYDLVPLLNGPDSHLYSFPNYNYPINGGYGYVLNDFNFNAPNPPANFLGMDS
ncbi:hypothetical protein SAMD00019534_125160, partial [Acytostelium subglobosum LB1]|uniref:hypothetical protein n=1 Tax=Acytostelium subglobosum LB1 TaxID=1410327 RepID=UPI00064488BF